MTGEFRYISNRDSNRALGPGLHGLSNGALDSGWPKVERSKRALADWLKAPTTPEQLFELLLDRRPATNPPDTGLDPEMEARLSAPFIVDHNYGTRCSTCVLVDWRRRCHFWEKRFDRHGQGIGSSQFRFALSS